MDTVDGRTPVPSWIPAGTSVPTWEVIVPGVRYCWYIRSENSAVRGL